MKPCSNPLCTNQIEDTDRFCGLCGMYVGPDITQGGANCPNCGRTLPPGQKFCPNCGSSATLIHPESSVPIASQADIPTVRIHHVSPPLVATRITSDELQIVRTTTKNVYAPYMRNLIRVPETSYSWGESIFSSNARNISDRLAMLEPEMDLTDFTLQAVVTYPYLDVAKEWGKEWEADYLLMGFVFRLNDQAGEGYYFLLDEGHTEEQWRLYRCYTRSEFTKEPLPRPKLGEKLRGGSISRFFGEGHAEVLVTIVAQGSIIDFYADLNHLARVENATLLHGKLGIHLYPYQCDGHCMGAKDLKVWIP